VIDLFTADFHGEAVARQTLSGADVERDAEQTAYEERYECDTEAHRKHLWEPTPEFLTKRNVL